MKKSFVLKQERQALLDESRALIETVEAETREFTPEEQTAHEERMKKIDDLTTKIAEREKLEGFQDVDQRDLPGAGMKTKPETEDEKEIRSLGEALIEKRDYVSTMNSSAFRPSIVDTKIREGLAVYSQLRKVGNVSSLAGDMNVPVDAGDVSVALIAEEGTYGDSAGTLNSIEFRALKVGGIIKFSDEALKDVPANLVDNALRQLVRATAKLENQWFVTGTGSSQPQGILTGSTEGVEAAAAAALAADDIRGLFTSLDTSLLPYAYGWCAQATMTAMLSLADKNKALNIDWDPTIGMYRVLGIPFFINANMPAIATGNKAIVIGDPHFYEIKDRNGVEVKVLDQLYAASGKVGYRFTTRMDAHLMDSAAFKHLVMA